MSTIENPSGTGQSEKEGMYLSSDEIQTMATTLKAVEKFCISGKEHTVNVFLHYLVQASIALTFYIKDYGYDGFIDEHNLNFNQLHDFIKCIEKIEYEKMTNLLGKLQTKIQI